MVAKPLEFRNTSYKDLLSFPRAAIAEAGFQLDKVQQGREPDDWKPMSSIGAGAMELRLWEEGGTFRVVYVAKLADAVYVLHCFQKKTQKTPAHDIDLAARRYRELIKEVGNGQ
ncbi:MAG: type II toxin-antitoxin system RelE/ParE family toxin [Hyphomicrobiales bacterium]|nr:MAG: type II toxin-antitoxin system RelE/ParE family toxin [Hyphomicrobiales bacterium]